ncbi:hypothetical protein ACFX13_019102 [Malus domestica]
MPIENGENHRGQKAEEENVKKSLFFPFYSPSPAYYFFSKKSPERSPTNVSSNSMPKWFFKLPSKSSPKPRFAIS